MDGAAQGGNPATCWPLTFEAAGEVLHCPMVEVTVAGCGTRLIVDTGATAHVLTMEFVERAGLRAAPAPPGRDVAGDAVPSWAVGQVVATVAGSDVVLEDVVAIEGPPPFQEWGVGGFMSPQALSTTTTAVLDLGTDTLEFFDREPTDLLTDLAKRFDGCNLVQGVRHYAGTLGVEVSVVGAARPATAIFDTGAAGTEMAADIFPSVITGAEQEGGRGVGGSSIAVRSLGTQRLEVGDARLVLPVLSVRDEIPSPDDAGPGEFPEALIGMDLLRGTALVVTPRDQGGVWWFVSSNEA